MAFWWVNHKQTYRKEIAGGYIWSPKFGKGGRLLVSYENMKKVLPNDLIFSYGDGEIRALGIVERPAIDSERPLEFKKTGEKWSNDGWLVAVRWERLAYSFIPKDYIATIAPLFPSKHSPLKPNGKGNEVYLCQIGEEFAEVLASLIFEKNQHIKSAIQDLSLELKTNYEVNNVSQRNVNETYKEQLIKARVGQGIFRDALEKIEPFCRLTNLQNKRLLIASHIKPWKDSNDDEKLDGHNGLLLSPHVDKLFDRGYISFSNRGEILLAQNEVLNVMNLWNLDPKKNVGTFLKEQQKYLEYHRDVVYDLKRKAYYITQNPLADI